MVVSSRKQEAVDAVAQAFREDGLYMFAIAANIRVNAICPGLIRTRFSAALWGDDEILARFLRHTPLARAGEADDDVAGLATFLASNAAAYCSGGAYTMDGRYLAN